jgi:hypothetical protein
MDWHYVATLSFVGVMMALYVSVRVLLYVLSEK